MRVALTTPEHIEQVLADLSPITSDELAAMQKSVDWFAGKMRDSVSYTLLGEQPLLILGVDEVPPHLWTWTAYTNAFWAAPLEATRAARYGLQLLSQRFDGQTIKMQTASPHPGADRWLRLIGFKPLGQRTYVLKVASGVK